MCCLLGGAWLVGMWMVGIVVMLIGVGVVVAAVLLYDDEPKAKVQDMSSQRRVMENYRRAR